MIINRRAPITLRICSMVISLASALVPLAERSDWAEEWLAEIYYRFGLLCTWRRAGLAQRVALVARCGGSVLDAAALRWYATGPRWASRHDKTLTAVYCYAVLSILYTLAPSIAVHVFGLSPRNMSCGMVVVDLCMSVASYGLLYTFFRRISLQLGVPFLQMALVSCAVGVAALGVTQVGSSPAIWIWSSVNENLYFSCLVLTTVLYLVCLRTTASDDNLGLLITGFGVQLSGPAAAYALAFLKNDAHLLNSFVPWFSRGCTFVMLLTWAYAVVRVKPPSGLPGQN